MRALFVYHVLPGDARPSALRASRVMTGLQEKGLEYRLLALRHTRTGRVSEQVDLPADVTVVPVRSMQNTTFMSAVFSRDGGFGRHIIRDPDVARAVEAGLRIVDDFKPDFIFSYVPPVRVSEVAFQISRASGVKWVMDWRDPLSFCALRAWPSKGFHEALARREDEWLAHAAALVTNAPALAAELKKKCPSKDATVILTGWEDIPTPPEKPSVAQGTLLYTGSVEGCSYGMAERFPPSLSQRVLRAVSGGTLAYVPNPEAVDYRPWGLAAVRAIASCGSSVKELIFRGGKPRGDLKRVLRRLGLWSKTSVRGWIASKEAWREMMCSHVLWLSRGGVTRTLGEPVISIKAFDYLASGRPIVAALPPDSDTARLLRGQPGVFVPDPGDEHALREAFREALALPPEKTFERNLEEYRFERQLEKLYSVLKPLGAS